MAADSSPRKGDRKMANQVVENGVKLVGERILPGTSLMMDGDIKGGLAHAALGLLARAAFGPVAWFAVAGRLVLALGHRQGPDRSFDVAGSCPSGPGAHHQ